MSIQTPLSPEAREKLDNIIALTAQAYGSRPGMQFTATPSVAQSLYLKIIEDGNPFLSQINMFPVTEMVGEKIGLDLSARVASRTDTSSTGERTPKRLLSLTANPYTCRFTEFDVAITYGQIDSWAKFPNLVQMYMTAVRRAIGNDMLVTGWYGASAAASTNLGSNPNLQDLNIGWLKTIRDFNSGSQAAAGTQQTPISIAKPGITGATYKTLDELVHDARQKLARPWRERDDLVAFIGSDILAGTEDSYYETHGNTPTEKALLQGRITKAYGGLPAIRPPFFPADALLITTFDNLSIYYQDSSVRRMQIENPRKNQIEEFQSVNLAYEVEEEFGASLVETITFKTS